MAEPDDRDSAFSEYYLARGASFRATAYLMCGDWHLAEDLTQTAFTKLYLAWRKVSRHDVLDNYVRRVLVNAFLDERRRPWRREAASGDPAGSPLWLDAAGRLPDVETGMELRAALAAVPRRQRAVLVLRYWEDLSVEQTAEILGCSTGNVKSQSSRGLNTLRAEMRRDASPHGVPR